MDFNSCMPAQEVSLTMAINDLSSISIFGCDDTKYDVSCLEVAWSYDGVKWSCFASYEDAEKVLVDAPSDFYVKFKVNGIVNDVKDNEQSIDYTTSIASGLSLPSCESTNKYNPYAGLTSALQLQQALSNSVACLVGIPIYYFKLKPNASSKDITFKEYTLMNVEAVKQIKLIVNEGQMPSSKPEFSDFGLDWQTDWETEINKSMFATAFGNNAQPMEGDLIYIPMMKRMWMVNESYEEKNGSLMWMNTTFKVALVKYQEKGSVDLGDFDSTIDSLVKNKYEDLFGDEEPLDSGTEGTETPEYCPDNSYPIYLSDATRKYMTTESIELINYKTYTKATIISNYAYKFNVSLLSTIGAKIIYQRKYCGEEGSISFIIGIDGTMNYETDIISTGNIQVHLKINENTCYITVPQCPELNAIIKNKGMMVEENLYFVWVRWSKKLNVSELGIAKYTYNESLPLYKLQPIHYKYDIDNAIYHKVAKWNIEMMQDTKQDIFVQGFTGIITNIKVFNSYIEDMSTLLQQYPTNQHLIVNDAARPIIENVGNNG